MKYNEHVKESTQVPFSWVKRCKGGREVRNRSTHRCASRVTCLMIDIYVNGKA